MLVQTAVVVLLAAAPALVQAAPSSISTGVTALKKLGKVTHFGDKLGQLNRFGDKHTVLKKFVGVKPTTKVKKHPGLKINTGLRQSMSPMGTGRNSFGFGGTPFSGRYTPSPFSGGRQMASPYGGYVAPYTPSYASPSSYGGYPYSPQPIVSPYSYVRRDTILSPRSELSPRALTSPTYSTPIDHLSTLQRASIGLPGHASPNLPSKYMRKGTHYRNPKAIHRNYGNDELLLEAVLEQAERVVNGLEEQLNKPKTFFPEIEAVKIKMKKMHAVQMAAAAKLAAAKPATPAAKPATPAKSG